MLDSKPRYTRLPVTKGVVSSLKRIRSMHEEAAGMMRSLASRN